MIPLSVFGAARPRAGGGLFSLTAEATGASGNVTPFSTTLAVGDPTPGRTVVFAFGWRTVIIRTVTSWAINGVPVDPDVITQGRGGIAFVRAAIPEGTEATLSGNWNSTSSNWGWHSAAYVSTVPLAVAGSASAVPDGTDLAATLSIAGLPAGECSVLGGGVALTVDMGSGLPDNRTATDPDVQAGSGLANGAFSTGVTWTTYSHPARLAAVAYQEG